MAEEVRAVWRCPGCGKEVPDGAAFVLAQEGQEDDAFSASDQLEVIWDHVRQVRFHPAHFREKIGSRYYRTVDAD